MNRVLVIGLLPDQQRMFEREFPRLDLRFAGAGVTGVNPETAKRADRVFLMTRFAAHAQQDRVPRSKLTLVRGGMDSLRDALQAYTSKIPLKEEHVGYVAPAREETDEEYMARINHEIGINDIRKKAPGESLLVERPHNMSKDAFKARLIGYRNYYRRTHNCPTEMEFAEDGNSVIVTRLPMAAPAAPASEGGIRSDAVLVGNEEALEAKPAPLASAFAEPATVQMEGTARPALATEALAHPTTAEQTLWERVLLESMRLAPGASMTHHTGNANAAAAAFRTRFG